MAQVTIGRDTINSSSVQMPPANNKAVCRFQNTSGADITITKAYGTWGSTYPSAKVKAVIYSDTAGPLPDTLLGTSDERIGILGTDWGDEFTFSTPVVIAAGAWVWIGVISDTTCSTFRALNSGTIKYNSDTYSDGASVNFGTASTAALTYPFFCLCLDDQKPRFGRASISTGAGTYTNDSEHGDKFVLGGSSSVSVNSISTYVTSTSASVKSKAAIYSDSGGSPGALIAQTSEGTGSTANTWLTLNFASPPTITPGTYWLCFITDSSIGTPTTSFQGKLRTEGAVTEASAWPSSITFTYDQAPTGINIYASYAIVPPPSTARPVCFVCT